MSGVSCGEGPVKRVKYSGDDDEGPREIESNCSDVPEVSKNCKESETGEADLNLVAPAFVDQYHVVKRIMEYLKIGDVLRAGTVNKQWSEIARIVRKQRKNSPYTILVHPYLPHHKLAFEYFNNFEVSEEAKELVESGKNGYHPYKLKSYPKAQFKELVKNSKAELRKAVAENAFDEPQLLVNFGTTTFDSHVIEGQTKNASKQRLRAVFGGVQDSIPCLTSFSCGVVGNVPEFNKSLEMERHKLPCLSSLAVPKVPGLRTKMFAITKAQNRDIKGKESAETCKGLLGINEEEDGHLKGIMLFHKVCHRASSVVDCIHKYLRSNPQVALAGGVHEHVLATNFSDESVVAAGMLIYGNENVSVSSVALQEPKMSTGNKKKLEKLKVSMIQGPAVASFAFMFACNGRGRQMHGCPNVESDLFNSEFSSTPMVGAFTFGEYCHEVLAGVESTSPKHIDFQYTTVFLLVSYKHPVETQE